MPRRPRRARFDGPLPLGPDTGPVPDWSARRLPPAGVDLPDYGSPAWLALADDDPCKVAATVAAAEAWRRSTHPAAVADRLRLELAAARHQSAVEAQAAAETAFHHIAATVQGSARRPSQAELAQERGDAPGLRRAWEQMDRTEAAFATHPRTWTLPAADPHAPSTSAGRAARARRLANATR